MTGEPSGEFSLDQDSILTMIYGAFAMSPRFMFEFLDENNIIVEIRKQDSGFFYTLDGVTEEGVFYPTRAEAEKIVFKEAVIKLEKQLI